MVIWWQVVSGIFLPKIIKIWQLVFKLQSKMLGIFFWDTVNRSLIIHEPVVVEVVVDLLTTFYLLAVCQPCVVQQMHSRSEVMWSSLAPIWIDLLVGIGGVGQEERVRDPVANVKQDEGEREALARDLVDSSGGVLGVVKVVTDGHLDGGGRGRGTRCKPWPWRTRPIGLRRLTHRLRPRRWRRCTLQRIHASGKKSESTKNKKPSFRQKGPTVRKDSLFTLEYATLTFLTRIITK